jgi:hypothetical protein
LQVRFKKGKLLESQGDIAYRAPREIR